jgi:hypothetical protein
VLAILALVLTSAIIPSAAGPDGGGWPGWAATLLAVYLNLAGTDGEAHGRGGRPYL